MLHEIHISSATQKRAMSVTLMVSDFRLFSTDLNLQERQKNKLLILVRIIITMIIMEIYHKNTIKSKK